MWFPTYEDWATRTVESLVRVSQKHFSDLVTSKLESLGTIKSS